MSDPFEEFTRNKMKEVDINTLQATIAKAIGDLLGTEYECDISKIEYVGLGAKFGVSISTPPVKFE